MTREQPANTQFIWRHDVPDGRVASALREALSGLVAARVFPDEDDFVVTAHLGLDQHRGPPSQVLEDLVAPELLPATLHLRGARLESLYRVDVLLDTFAHTVAVSFHQPEDRDGVLRAVGIIEAAFPRATHGSPSGLAFEDPTQTPVRLRPGVQIDRYRLLSRLGKGFSSEVWKTEVVVAPPGVRLAPGDIVAMKQYLPFIVEGLDSVRIQREFRVANEIDHPRLVKVYDLVLSPSRPLHSFMVMEYVPGETLRTRIPRRGMPAPDVIDIGLQLFEALDVLHGYGALHRDIKPANIMFRHGNDPHAPLDLMLLDLGIVHVVQEQNITETSTFIGSKHTASPEQLFGEDLDARSDIYSVAATMYHCYTGTPLYGQAGPATAIVRAMLEQPASCESKNGDADRGLVAFVNNCLERDPADRPSSAGQCLETVKILARWRQRTAALAPAPADRLELPDANSDRERA